MKRLTIAQMSKIRINYFQPLLIFTLVISGFSEVSARNDTKASFQAPSRQDIARLIERINHDQSIAERLVDVSAPFVGAPYVVSPLGEGKGQDPDPRIRFDAFDCTTFVETVLALAFSSDIAGAENRLDRIRYQEEPFDFIRRRHFPEAEWIPELIQAGYFEDITQNVGRTNVSLESKYLDIKVWDRRRKPRHFELPESRIPEGTYALPSWKLEQALKHYQRIPPGVVLNVVRVNFQSVPVRVSHQGLVIKKGKTLYLRHAADRMYHSVVDEPLKSFLWRIAQYKKWPVHGVNLLKIKRPYQSNEALPVRLPLTPLPFNPKK